MPEAPSWLDAARDGIAALDLPVDVRDAAVARLAAWARDPERAEDLPALRGLLADGRLDELADAFRTALPFGTGGCRAAVGVGPNRFNPTTLARLVRAHAAWLREAVPEAAARGVVIGWDPRVFADRRGLYDPRRELPLRGWSSARFAALAAGLYAEAGIAVRPPPAGRWLSVGLLSYAIRATGAAGGLYVSASHNPPDDNGAKLYDATGAQLVPPDDAAVARRIGQRPASAARGATLPLDPPLWDAWSAALASAAGPAPRGVRVVFSGLHGVGGAVVPPVLRAAGVEVIEVPEQALPDGAFSTVPGGAANPEHPAALARAIALAESVGAELALATDPDADRVGAAIPTPAGWVALSGQQIAALCADVACEAAPPGALVLRTAVTTSVVSRIAAARGLPVIDELPVGFKHVGAALAARERAGLPTRVAVAVEESHGVLISDVMRDKDAAGGALLLCRAAARGDLAARLRALDAAHGTVRHHLATRAVSGATGLLALARALASFAADPPLALGGLAVAPTSPPAGASLAWAAAGGRVVLRASGTEPKLKAYAEAEGGPGEAAAAVQARAVALAEGAADAALARAG